MPVVPIHSADDPRIADYRDLKEGERGAAFIAEGLLVVEALLARGRYPVRSVLVADGKLTRLPAVPPELTVYVAPQAVLDRVVGFAVHRGVLAAGLRSGASEVEALLAALPGPATVVVGAGLSNHDNVGALFRNAAALGGAAVLLDDRSADPLYRKAIRVSMGHALTLPTAARAPWTRVAAALAAHGFESWVTTPRADAEDLAALVHSGATAPARVALWVGAEGDGLPDEILAAASRRVRIPMAADVDSLNVATAAAVALFAIGALARGPAHPPGRES